MKSSGKSFQTILVAFIALALVSGIFVASNATTTAMDNVVVCVNKKTGTMRLPMKDKCKKKEQKIVLARTGPQGIQGVQGAIGPAGPAGPVGSGGNYLNTQYGVYDSNGKLTPLEIMSLDYQGEVLRLENYLLPSVYSLNYYATGSEKSSQGFLYKDEQCSQKSSAIQSNQNKIYPYLNLVPGYIEMFASTNNYFLPLAHWGLSKYGKYFIKYKTTEKKLFRYQRQRLSELLYYPDIPPRRELREFQNRLKYISYTGLAISSDNSGICTEVSDFFEVLKTYFAESFILTLDQYAGRPNWLPDSVFNLNEFESMNSETSLEDLIELNAFTSYAKDFQPKLWESFVSTFERYDRWRFYKLDFFKRVTFRFQFPLELRGRK